MLTRCVSLHPRAMVLNASAIARIKLLGKYLMSSSSKHMDKHALDASRYGFSGARIEGLGASEHTLVGTLADASGLVGSSRAEIEQCVKETVSSCRSSPLADNLMWRFTTLDNHVREVHGFKPLAACHLDQ